MNYKGPEQVSERTVGAVMRMLARQGKPMTITQLSEIFNKSYNTIKRALERGGAVQVGQTHPKVFTIPELYEPERVVGNHREVVSVKYALMQPQIPRWNENRAKFSKNLAAIHITEDDDPAKLAEQFASAAAVLASLAYDIQMSMEYVDWFEKLGGNDESA